MCQQKKERKKTRNEVTSLDEKLYLMGVGCVTLFAQKLEPNEVNCVISHTDLGSSSRVGSTYG